MNNVSWIYNSAILIVAIEFLSIHASGMSYSITGTKKINLQALILFGFYLFFTIVLGVFFKNIFILLFFLLSTIGKLFEAERSKTSKVFFIRSIVIFTLLILICGYAAPLWELIFPFSSDVLAAKPENAKGVFFDVPQTVLVWGVLYFSMHFIINLVLSFKKSNN